MSRSTRLRQSIVFLSLSPRPSDSARRDPGASSERLRGDASRHALIGWVPGLRFAGFHPALLARDDNVEVSWPWPSNDAPEGRLPFMRSSSPSDAGMTMGEVMGSRRFTCRLGDDNLGVIAIAVRHRRLERGSLRLRLGHCLGTSSPEA